MPSILKALNEATNSSGGFTVPDEFSSRLLALVQSNTVVMEDLDTRKMISDTQYVPKVTSGTTAYWITETASITDSTPGYGQITLSAKKVAAMTIASSEILEDNNVDLANSLVDQMAKDIGLSIDGALYTGGCTRTTNTGAASPFQGLIHTASYTNAVDYAGNTNITGAIGSGSGITSGAITIKAIAAAVAEVLSDNHQQPNVSYWNPRTIGALLQLTDSTSRPVLNSETYGSPTIRDGKVGVIYGTTVKPCGQLPINLVYGTTAASSASSDAFVGVSKEFGILGDRRGFIWKTFYDISKDVYEWQTTARMAFAVKYPNSYCLIRAITN